MLRTGTPDARVAAARALARTGDLDVAVAALAEVLGSTQDGDLRAAIAHALARRGGPRAVAALEDALGRAPRVPGARAMVHALASIGTEPAATALLALADTPARQRLIRDELPRLGRAVLAPAAAVLEDPAREEIALEALSRVPDTSSVPLLVPRLTDGRRPIRMAVLRALGRIADPRAAPALEARLAALPGRAPTDEGGATGVTAGELALLFDAWAGVATGSEAAALIAPWEGPETPVELRAAALRARARIDPPGSRDRLASLLGGSGSPLRRAALDAVLAARHPALAPLLEAVGRSPEHADEAAATLAELLAGAGIPGLLVLSREEPPSVRWAALRELAVAARRWPASPGADPARRRLRAATASRVGRSDHALVELRALARDQALAPRLAARLDAPDPTSRALAARAAVHLPSPALRAPLRRALLRSGGDGELDRALVRATLAQGMSIDPAILAVARARLDREPVWLLLLGRALPGVPPEHADDVRRILLEATRRRDPRAAALACRALALAGDAAAGPSLLRLAADPRADVRRSAARALAALAPEDLVEELAALHRTEPRDDVRAELARAADAASGVAGPAPVTDVGDQVARFRVTAPGGGDAPSPLVDVLTSDGDWWRFRPGAGGGDLLLSDRPRERLEVRPLAR